MALAMLLGGASAYVLPMAGAPVPLAARRPVLRSPQSAPSMLLDAPTVSTLTSDALGFVSSLLASEAEAEEIGPLLLAQMAVCGVLVGGGTALDVWGNVEEPEEEDAEPGSVDIYRDTALRYMGYANECGEAFRPLVPTVFVYLTYVGAIVYILADTFDKGKKGANKNTVAGILGASDTFLWQMLASVIFPSFCINRLVLLLVSLQADPSCPEFLSADFLPTIAGLVSIPLLIKPLDTLAHQTLNLSFRKVSEALEKEAA